MSDVRIRILKVAVAVGLAAVFAAGTAAAAGEAAAAAVTVNGTAIPAAAIEAEYRWICTQKQMMHPTTDTQQAACLKEAVDRVVVWELVRQRLAADGHALSGADLDAAVAADRARIGDSFGRYIGMLGQDEASYRRRVEGVQNFKRYQQEQILPSLKVSADEVKARYGQSGAYQSAEAYRVRYLQVHSFDRTGRLVHGDLPAVAAHARKRVAEGVALEQVAEEITTSQVAGRVANGYYEVGKYPLYEPALKPLTRAGDVSEPLMVTENSYLIFRLEEKVAAKDVRLEQARPEIERQLLETKLNEAIPGHVAGLIRKAEVKYLDPKYAPKQ